MIAAADAIKPLPARQSPPKRFKLTADDFHRMGDLGMLGEHHQRLELVDGEILELMPIGRRHAAYVDRLNRILSRRLPEEFAIRVQNPIRLNRVEEPIPDVALLVARADDFFKSPPGPADCALIIEVADTSLDYDLGAKAESYATAGIGEYWVFDVEGECIHVLRQPQNGIYGERFVVKGDDTLVPLSVPGLRLVANELIIAG